MKKQKTVCIVHHTGAMGGGTKSFLDIIDMLKNDFHVIACIPRGCAALRTLIEERDVRIHETSMAIPVLPRYSGGSPLFSRSMVSAIFNLHNIRGFCKEIENMGPDAIIYNSIVSTISAPWLKKDICKICMVRETIVHRFSKLLFRKILDNYFNGVCFLANFEMKKMSLANAKSVVIPDSLPSDGVRIQNNRDARNAEGLDYNEYIALYMGGTLPIKGVNLALNSISVLGSGYRLLIAGEFNEQELTLRNIFSHWYSIRYISYMLKLRHSYYKALKSNLVTLVGYRKSISTIMSASDIVLFPSTKVHQPRPCIEAGYYSKPVIISDFIDTQEYFIDGYNAITFAANCYKDLARKIEYAKKHPLEVEILGENNLTMSNKYHDYVATSQTLHDFLAQILN